jgi:hypothetical protein
MKVSELTELASKQVQAINAIERQANARVKAAYETHASDAVREALGRLDVLDDFKRIGQLQQELNVLQRRVRENLGDTTQSYAYHSIVYAANAEDAIAACSRFGTQLPPYLAEEIQQVMLERGVQIALGYRAPDTAQLVREFKQCQSLAELKNVMHKHHQEALTHFGPVLKATTPTHQEGHIHA